MTEINWESLNKEREFLEWLMNTGGISLEQATTIMNEAMIKGSLVSAIAAYVTEDV